MNPLARSVLKPRRLARPLPAQPWVRALSTPSETAQQPASASASAPTTTEPTITPPPASTAPPPPPKLDSPPKPPYINAERWQAERAQLIALLHKTRLEAERRWTAWLSTAQATAKERYQQLELERKLKEAGAKINEATGYEEIDRLRLRVGTHEKELLQLRTAAADAKARFNEAMQLRIESQREVNDLLQRKSHWNSQDVIRFTELVQQDHENERSEQTAKAQMEAADLQVERAFSDLMQAILERYHEEQVWSDKIRSLSTYGSLGITSLNVLLFIITLLLIEPWKRRRLVNGVEERLRNNTNESNEATQASLLSLQNLLTDAQAKIDQLLPLATQAAQAAHLATAPASALAPARAAADLFLPDDEPNSVQGSTEAVPEPATLHDEGELRALDRVAEEAVADDGAEGRQEGWLERLGVGAELSERDRELALVGVVGALAGVGLTGLMGMLRG